MKKTIVASLAAAMVMGIAGTSFAASNPFVDVPAKHWSYDSVTKLAQAGIVDGYADGKFQGDKVMTRYEMAQVVAKAMAKSDKADASQKAIIEKLSKEYATELEGLNVRMTNVEKRVSALDKVSVDGIARVRYDHEKNDRKVNSLNQPNINMDIFYGYKVNDEWSVKGESEFNRNLRHTAANNENDNHFKQLYVTGPIAGVDVKAGKFSYTPTYGVIFDSQVRGAQVAFGNKLKTTLTVGKTATSSDAVAADLGSNASNLGDDLKYQAIDMEYATSKVTNIKANYQKFTTTTGASVGADVDFKAYEVGFDTKFGKDFGFKAAYAKTDADTLNKAYLAQVQYKVADINVVGSNDAYVGYRKFQPNATFDTVNDYEENFKGIVVGYEYVPMKNAKFSTFYMNGKTADTDAVKTKIYRAQVELFF